MAVGFDTALPSRSAPAFPQRQASQQQSIPAYGGRPAAISDAAVQDVMNNQMASGYGARESALNSMNRAGISRGKAQRYFGQVAQESADTQGQVDAAKTAMGAAQANATANQEYQNTMRQEQLANSGLLEGLRNTSAMERLARLGWQQNMREAMQRGRYGLDSMQLDYTPLLQHLFD